jgi:hypothetical protein
MFADQTLSSCLVSARMLAAVVVAALMTACGGGGGGGTPSSNPNPSHIGTLTSPPVAGGNVLPIVLDAGPVAGASQINMPYVSVTVCTPGTSGTTAACQTIDHVQVDTGSSGLRLLNSALYSNLNLPVVSNANGQAIGECVPFGIGTTWGSVRRADVYLAGEVARSISIQDIGDQPGGMTTIPQDCSNTGTIQDTQTLLGANGILGVGLFTNDCDACLSQAIAAAYYACNAGGCTNSSVTAAQMVKNPVALFQNPVTGTAQDNNGVLIQLPAVATAGATALAGSLIFGIGTQSNNALGSATVYATDTSGNFNTTYNGVSMPTSFIDSGSNALLFNDANIPSCTINSWLYCPTPSPLTLSATNSAATGSASGVVSFSIVGLDNLNPATVAASIGGSTTGGYFDWGLPFFFGRSVYTAISGASTPGRLGPYFAY